MFISIMGVNSTWGISPFLQAPYLHADIQVSKYSCYKHKPTGSTLKSKQKELSRQ